MEPIDNQINSFLDVIKNENGVIRSCVVATVDSQDSSRVLLTRCDRTGQRPIGYAKASAVLGEVETPAYSEDFAQVEHCLLQKTITADGNKSLLYMLPIQDENNQLLGGYLFQKTKVGETETVKFKGSVSPSRFNELKEHQIPEKEWGMIPFVEKYIPIVPDTKLPLISHHYGKPKPAENTIALMAARLRDNQYA